MNKVYATARALAILAAIVGAFVTMPNIAVLLLALGAISAIGNSAEDTTRLILISLVLAMGSKSLEVIPGAGVYLSTIFSGIGTATFGASVMGVCFGIYRRIRGDWMPAAT